MSIKSYIKTDTKVKKVKAAPPGVNAIGIIGGMGPMATVDLFKKILDYTPRYKEIKNDQDHIPVYISSIPQTPDRTQYILDQLGSSIHTTEDPFPYLVKSAENVIQAGARVIGIPCNTSHFFIDELKKAIKEKGYEVNIINMIDETEKAIRYHAVQVKKIGLLATTGTIQTQLYNKGLEEKGYEILIPDDDIQENFVMEGIYGYKSGRGVKKGFFEEPKKLFIKAGEHLVEKGADAIIGGCTEIPLVVDGRHFTVPFIDPTEELARALIKKAIQNNS